MVFSGLIDECSCIKTLERLHFESVLVMKITCWIIICFVVDKCALLVLLGVFLEWRLR